MKKLLLLSLFLLLMGESFAQQTSNVSPEKMSVQSKNDQMASSGSVGISYFGKGETSFGIPGQDMRLAICLPEKTMKRYVGNQLTQLEIGIGQDAGMKNTEIFLTYDLEEDPFYTQKVTFEQKPDRTITMNTISLTTPYQIEGKKIYVGYKLTCGRNRAVGIGIDGGPVNQLGDFFYGETVGGDFRWGHLWETGALSCNVLIRAVLEGSSLPQYDVTFDYLSPSKLIASKDETVTVNGAFKNMGTEKITSFDLTYKQGKDEQIKTRTFKGENIPNGMDCNFEIKGLKITEDGVTKITDVRISSINGNEYSNTNDNLLSTSIACKGESTVPRKVLVENFTISRSYDCPAGDNLLNDVLGENKNIIRMAHHAGYTKDNYTIDQSILYTKLFNITDGSYSGNVPSVMVDRTRWIYSGIINSPLFLVNANNKNILELSLKDALAEPAYVTVKINKEFDAKTCKLNVTVSGNSLLGSLPGMPRLNVFLTENNIVGKQTMDEDGTVADDYVHNNVIRDELSNLWGDPVDFDESGNYTKTYSYVVDREWKAENMRIVAFLSNYDDKNMNGNRVFNAEQAILSTESSIENTSSDNGVRVYSENSQITIDGEYTNVVIYNMAGSVVDMIGEKPNSVKVDSGVYLVKVINDNNVSVKKVTVK